MNPAPPFTPTSIPEVWDFCSDEGLEANLKTARNATIPPWSEESKENCIREIEWVIAERVAGRRERRLK